MARSFPFVALLAAVAFLTAAAHLESPPAPGVVAWGDNGQGQCDVPAPPPGVTYVEVDAGWKHTVVRRSDGQAVAWGYNFHGQCDVPAPPPGQLRPRSSGSPRCPIG